MAGREAPDGSVTTFVMLQMKLWRLQHGQHGKHVGESGGTKTRMGGGWGLLPQLMRRV